MGKDIEPGSIEETTLTSRLEKEYEAYFQDPQGIQGPPCPQDVGPDWL